MPILPFIGSRTVKATPILRIVLPGNMTLGRFFPPAFNVNSAFIVHLTLKANFLLINRRVVKRKKLL